MDSIKLYATNTLVLMLSFANIENTLKIILLLCSITYTVFKIIEEIKKRKNETR
jgi:hypothetical protein